MDKEVKKGLIELLTELMDFILIVLNWLTGNNSVKTDDKKPEATVKPEQNAVIKDYFSNSELQGYKSQMSKSLMGNVNKARHVWGLVFNVSTAGGAVGRHTGKGDHSMHNIDYWGKVYAIDLFIKSKIHSGYINTYDEAIQAVKLLRTCGLTGIGVYPHFNYAGKKAFGFHVDIRKEPLEWIDTAYYPAHNYEYGKLENLLKGY